MKPALSSGFATQLNALVRSLDRGEALRRRRLIDFELLGLLEEKMSDPLRDVYDVCRRCWPNAPPPDVVKRCDDEILAPAWSRGWASHGTWRYSADFYIVALLSAVVGIPDSADPDEIGDIAVALAQLGIPEQQLIAVYQTVFPELERSAEKS